MSDVVIIDYGLGNIFNVQMALQSVGAGVHIAQNTADIIRADRLVLPGVGSFADGMNGLKMRGLIEPIQEAVRRGASLLGICLGMQLLMSSSEENGNHEGLGIVKGRVARLKSEAAGGAGVTYKVPHFGWNEIEFCTAVNYKKPSLLQDIPNHSHFYFMHSYCVLPEDETVWVAQTRYGSNEFCSVLADGNVIGCQFHPERSGQLGLRMLKNFCSIPAAIKIKA